MSESAKIDISNGSYFKYKRRRSQRACQTCNKRKVRCDLTLKNDSNSKCTNCEEFGIECIVSKRKRKRTKVELEIEAEKTKISKQYHKLNPPGDEFTEELESDDNSIDTLYKSDQYQNSKALKRTSMSRNNSHRSTSPIKVKNEIQMVDPFNQMNGDEIFIDVDSMLNKEISGNTLSEGFRLLFPNSGGLAIKKTILEYYQLRNKAILRNLISKEYTKILELSGCFILPSKEKSMKYIGCYFKTFHQYYPCLNSLQFLRDFRDLSNPPSLLMLRSMLYLGCKMMATNQEEIDEASILYEKAKLVYSAKMETNGIYLVMSILMLGLLPSTKTSIEIVEETINKAIRVATSFGMHKDMTNNIYLSESDKKVYKRIICFLMIKERSFAMCFSKKLNMELASCTIKPLVYSDFDDCGVENQAFIFEGINYSMQFQTLVDEVMRLQKQSNQEALNLKPFAIILKKAHKLINDFENNISGPYKNRTNSCVLSVILQSSVISLKLVTRKIDLLRIHAIFEKLILKQPLTDQTLNYLNTVDSYVNNNLIVQAIGAHQIADIICTDFPKLRNYLPFCQDMIFILYQFMTYSTMILFHKNEKMRSRAKDDIKRVTKTLEDTPEIMNAPMMDAVHYILKEIVPNKLKLIEFSRLNVNSATIEKLMEAIMRTKRDDLIYAACKHLPSFTPSLYNFGDEFILKTTSYGKVNSDINNGELDINNGNGDDLYDELKIEDKNNGDIDVNNIHPPLVINTNIADHDDADTDFLKTLSPLQKINLNSFLIGQTPVSETLTDVLGDNTTQFIYQYGQLPNNANPLNDLHMHNQILESINIGRTPVSPNNPELMDLFAVTSPQKILRSRINSLNDILNPVTPTTPLFIHPPLSLDGYNFLSSDVGPVDALSPTAVGNPSSNAGFNHSKSSNFVNDGNTNNDKTNRDTE